jgi:hypothetical protein
LENRNVYVVTATATEARFARKALPSGVEVIEAGIALAKRRTFDGIAISCGLAGGLRRGIPTGAILIPGFVRAPDGRDLQMDAVIAQALRDAARELGYDPLDAPLLSSESLIHGSARETWGAQGFAGVDMETALIDAPRVACVRVVLDTPEREISPRWLKPATAILYPDAWRDLPFLAREGPRCAQIAAEILAAALPRFTPGPEAR